MSIKIGPHMRECKKEHQRVIFDTAVSTGCPMCALKEKLRQEIESRESDSARLFKFSGDHRPKIDFDPYGSIGSRDGLPTMD